MKVERTTKTKGNIAAALFSTLHIWAVVQAGLRYAGVEGWKKSGGIKNVHIRFTQKAFWIQMEMG